MPVQTFNRVILLAFVATLLVHLYSLFRLDLINVDSSQYAYIAKEMLLEGNYLEVYCRGADYLDKPPLVFWLSCLFYKLFGFQHWAFRLASFAIHLLGLYSLYRYAKIYYGHQVAALASLVMATTVASFLMVTDVRTDTMLTGWVIFSLWQLAAFNQHGRFGNIILAAAGIGLAMLSKGPLGLMVPALAFSCEFLYKRQWKRFFRWQYLPALVVIALILLPMSIGLYRQFDLHPEKQVYGLDGPSGLRFFFWTQSFGRISGEIYWDNNPDPFFLYHSFLWSFMPWTLFFIPAIWFEFREKFRALKHPEKPEIITLSAFVLIVFIMSRSRYQLPHYTFVVHPLAALIAARYIHRGLLSNRNTGFSRLATAQNAALLICFLLSAAILLFVFPGAYLLTGFTMVVLVAYLFVAFRTGNHLLHRTVSTTVIAAVMLYLVLSVRFYPSLLKYQSDRSIAETISREALNEKLDDYGIIEWQTACGYALDFYAERNILHTNLPLEGQLHQQATFVVAEDTAACFRENPGGRFIAVFDEFPVTQLTGEFLNPATRVTQLRKKYLLRY